MNPPMYQVACNDCGWSGLTFHAELKPHHACPNCDCALSHRQAGEADKQAFYAANKTEDQP